MSSSVTTSSPPSISDEKGLIADIQEGSDCDPCYNNSTLAVNNTEDVSSSSVSDITEYFYQIETLTCLWVLFALIVIGNGTVLVALTLSKGRKSRMNFFIKNLALADLLVGLVSLLTDIVWKTTISWNAGWFMCKLIRYLQTVVTYASTYVLVALSIDRYDAITHPMNFSGSWTRARVLVIVAWGLSFVFSIPILFVYKIKAHERYGDQCYIGDGWENWHWMIFMTIASLLVFIIPAIIIAVCYIAIVCTIWNKGKETALMPANGNNNGNAMVTTSGGQLIEVKRKTSKNNNDANGSGNNGIIGGKGTGSDEVETRRASSRGLIPKAKVKTVKMTFVIISVFILCWSPYIIHDLLQVYGVIPMIGASKGIQAAVATLIQSLSSLNSAANPLIYCLFSTNIGATICTLLKCRKQPVNMRTGMTTTTNYSTAKQQANSTVSLLGNSSVNVNRQRQQDAPYSRQQFSKPLLESSESIHPETLDTNAVNTTRQVY